MVTEIVLLLGFLGFLAIRNDYIQRRGPFILALVFWGLTRLLTELTFRGDTSYEWGSRSACAAAVCLFLCLSSMYWACARPLVPAHPRDSHTSDKPDAQTPPPPQKDPSERIRELIDEEPHDEL